jgi:hypothetical protein
MMWRSTPYDLLSKSIDEGWDAHVAGIRSATLPARTACGGCQDRLACGNCAATSLIETGVAGRNVSYYCRISKARELIFSEEMAIHE